MWEALVLTFYFSFKNFPSFLPSFPSLFPKVILFKKQELKKICIKIFSLHIYINGLYHLFCSIPPKMTTIKAWYLGMCSTLFSLPLYTEL